MRAKRCIPLILSCALFWGCPGELKVNFDQGVIVPDAPQGDAIIIGGGDTLVVPPLEGGADIAGQWDTGAAPDIMIPDLSSPDSSVILDKGPTTGGKCPCAVGSGLTCVNNACRAQCKAPTDGCKAISNCPAAEACVETSKKGFWVCIPGSAPGKSCSGQYFCAQKHVCAKFGSASYLCLPVCSVPNASCGTSGGKCYKASSSTCMFCSKP